MNTQLIISIEQAGYSNQFEISLGENPKIQDAANVILNAALGDVVMNRLLSPKAIKLNQPFVFNITFERGDRVLDIPEFKSKLSLGEKGIEKLIQNMPQVLALQMLPMNMGVGERMKAIQTANIQQLELV